MSPASEEISSMYNRIRAANKDEIKKIRLTDMVMYTYYIYCMPVHVAMVLFKPP